MKVFSLESHGFSMQKTKIQSHLQKMNQLQTKESSNNRWYKNFSTNQVPYVHVFLRSLYKFSFMNLQTHEI